MTTTLDLELHPFRAPQPAGDTIRSFREVLADYRDGHLQIPPHQRDPGAWEHDKRQEYIARLLQSAQGCHPPGSFATYQIVNGDGQPSPIYLNDGFQRLTALAELQENPARYSMAHDGVDALVRQNVSVQHRHYQSHEDAMRDFQLINNGTRLTPYELCRGILKYIPGYSSYWAVFLENAEQAMRDSEARLRAQTKRTKQEREHEHKRRRHTLALLHRFLTKEQRYMPYLDVPAKDVQNFINKGEVVEMRLRDVLVQMSREDADGAIKLFRKFLQDETSVLENRIQDILGRGTGLSPVTHRWLLDLAVWRRNTSTPRDEYCRFVDKLLEATRGQAQWQHDSADGKRETVTLSLSHLGKLPKLAEFADMPEFCQRQRRKTAHGLLPGYDNSHLDPFVTNGDGPTFAEPAPINRSRGAKPVEGIIR
jgi:hypothetical protein